MAAAVSIAQGCCLFSYLFSFIAKGYNKEILGDILDLYFGWMPLVVAMYLGAHTPILTHLVDLPLRA